LGWYKLLILCGLLDLCLQSIPLRDFAGKVFKPLELAAVFAGFSRESRSLGG
jgi:hypothetical protein